MKEWLDRSNQKTTISDWLASDSTQFLLTVKDSIELRDIIEWLEEKKLEKTSSIVYLNADSEVTKFGLLEELVYELGNENFPNFTSKQLEYNNIAPHLTIKQQIGGEIRSESYINLNENSQSIDLGSFDLSSLQIQHLEKDISNLLHKFSEDLTVFCKKKSVLLICVFNKGFCRLDQSFKAWFRDQFLKRVKKKHRLKLL